MSLPRTMLAGLCAVALVAGCSPSGATSDGTASGGVKPADGPLVDDATFRFPLAFDPGELDAATNVGMGKQFLPFAYDSLVASRNGNEIVGNLATKWVAGPKEATFTTREGVTCSDGSAVTPSVIAESFDFYRTDKAQDRPFGDVSDWKVSGDDAQHTVTFTFSQPVGFPVEALAYVPVVCGKGLKDRSLLKRGTSGSGPYVLTKSVPNDRYVLERREGYTWGPDGATTAEPGLPKTVELRVVTDPSTAVNMLLARDLDGAGLPESARERLGTKARAIPVPSELGQLVYNNAKDRATGAPEVRRALTMAVDREAMATVAKGTLAHNLSFPFTDPCPAPDNREAIPAHDPKAAGKLLEDAGWVKGADGVRTKDGKRLRLDVLTANDFSAEFNAAATLAVKAWRAVGFDVRSRSLTGTAMLQEVVSGAWDVAPMSALGSLNPAQLTGVISGAEPPTGSNLARVSNPEYDKLAAQALQAGTPEAVCTAWNGAERALYAEANLIPVVAGNRYFAMGAHLDFAVNMAGVVPTSVRVHGG